MQIRNDGSPVWNLELGSMATLNTIALQFLFAAFVSGGRLLTSENGYLLFAWLLAASVTAPLGFLSAVLVGRFRSLTKPMLFMIVTTLLAATGLIATQVWIMSTVGRAVADALEPLLVLVTLHAV